MPRATKKNTPVATAKEPAPHWVQHETLVIQYTLEATAYVEYGTDISDDVNHKIELTQDEYHALQLHLAELRGYEVPEAE